ncbi:SagB/ThcOx family dehydrogenase [Candidatus Enterococcus courvalinii]|uniref:SagB/ThcOx family dehydrogenase n=1 Tax=Candidatus Enterococcus courvalinii TaxID=2815329 RepID=A0ABS3HXR9_9ENTE|nr:SagB/ThcOx family dehydrogenase [Enterococcus sp. MSG2901]MBO0481264.1 SagB/ThcOx family dehydrogenase [Enterococcus sp. MSG2901]
MLENRSQYYADEINKIKENISKYDDLEQVGILHEVIDDTPFKTQNYMKYLHDEYYIIHTKKEIIDESNKFYKLAPEEDGTANNLYKIIKNRNSIRDYQNKTISFEAFSNIIYYSFGVKSITRGAYDQRDYPFKYINSQGGLNYLDLYIFVNNVESIEKGLYYYDFINNRLCQMDYGNYREIIAKINYQNEFTVYGNFVTVLVADLSRVVPKYYKRAYRMAHVDSGIAIAYLELLAENLGISSCVVAGYLEHVLEDTLELTKNDYPILTASFGYKSDTSKSVW